MSRHSPEHAFQAKLIEFLAIAGRRELFWFAIGNGEHRHISVGIRLKAEGVTPGVPDLCIMLEDGRSAWLELKAPKGALSDAQKGFHARALRLGHLWACVKSMAEAFDVLKAWGVLRPGVSLAGI